MRLQILTPTGARPEAISLCEEWMTAQTYTGQVHWVIVDDGAEAQGLPNITNRRTNWSLSYIRAKPYWEPGQNTQARNILKGLEYVNFDHPVVFIEDDDWYHPDWLTACAEASQEAELTGEGGRALYHVGNRTWQLRPTVFDPPGAVLGASTLRGPALDHLASLCRTHIDHPNPKLDLRLWNGFKGSKHVFYSDLLGPVGIKGMPGRPGVMGSHRAKLVNADPDGHVLRSWVGDDAADHIFAKCEVGHA